MAADLVMGSSATPMTTTTTKTRMTAMTTTKTLIVGIGRGVCPPSRRPDNTDVDGGLEGHHGHRHDVIRYDDNDENNVNDDNNNDNDNNDDDSDNDNNDDDKSADNNSNINIEGRRRC